MGYVYTLAEFAKGRIAKKEYYPIAIDMLRRALSHLHADGLIHGAVIHGGVAHGDWGVGSDVDTLVITNNDESLDFLRDLRDNTMRGRHVPIEFIPIPLGLARSGHHTVDHLYGLYIRTFCMDGLVGGDPFAVIAPNDTWGNPRKEVTELLVSYLDGMPKARANNPRDHGAEHCRDLEKLIRRPIYAAIDLLRLRHGNYPANGDGRPLSKSACCDMFEAEFPDMAPAFGDLRKVMETRTRYRRFLMEGNCDVDGYRGLLDDIDGTYPSTMNVIEASFDYLMAHPGLR